LRRGAALASVHAIPDLASDPSRKGAGTDFAGVRPYLFSDDYHRIDWKATARTSKLMTREYRPETDPPIILIVDSSLLTDQSAVTSVLGKLVWDGQLSGNAIGLILFGEHSILSNIEPRVGVANRRRILQTTIEASRPGRPAKLA
jgi:uncharacterized protein (DUF58 family)